MSLAVEGPGRSSSPTPQALEQRDEYRPCAESRKGCHLTPAVGEGGGGGEKSARSGWTVEDSGGGEGRIVCQVRRT